MIIGKDKVAQVKKDKLLISLIVIVLVTILASTACSKGPATGGAKVKRIEISLTEEAYAFGVDKNQPELLDKVNAFIQKIQTDGSLNKIFNNYFGDGSPEAIESAIPDSSKDQLIVATNASFEPFEYTLGDKYLGVDMEIAKLLADYLGKELVISNMDFDAVCLSVGQQKADIAMAGLTVNESRKAFVTFSDSYYQASQQLIVPATDKTFDGAKTAEEVEAILAGLGKDVKIGVQTGTTAQFYLEGDEDWEFDGFDVHCVGYNSGSLAVQDMLNGNLSFVVIDEAPATFIVDAVNKMG